MTEMLSKSRREDWNKAKKLWLLKQEQSCSLEEKYVWSFLWLEQCFLLSELRCGFDSLWSIVQTYPWAPGVLTLLLWQHWEPYDGTRPTPRKQIYHIQTKFIKIIDVPLESISLLYMVSCIYFIFLYQHICIPSPKPDCNLSKIILYEYTAIFNSPLNRHLFYWEFF